MIIDQFAFFCELIHNFFVIYSRFVFQNDSPLNFSFVTIRNPLQMSFDSASMVEFQSQSIYEFWYLNKQSKKLEEKTPKWGKQRVFCLLYLKCCDDNRTLQSKPNNNNTQNKEKKMIEKFRKTEFDDSTNTLRNGGKREVHLIANPKHRLWWLLGFGGKKRRI